MLEFSNPFDAALLDTSKHIRITPELKQSQITVTLKTILILTLDRLVITIL
jgi:hypothetical protein